MSYEPKTVTIDVWHSPPGDCGTTGLEKLSTLELVYLYRETTRRIEEITGRKTEDFLDGMKALLAPA